MCLYPPIPALSPPGKAPLQQNLMQFLLHTKLSLLKRPKQTTSVSESQFCQTPVKFQLLGLSPSFSSCSALFAFATQVCKCQDHPIGQKNNLFSESGRCFEILEEALPVSPLLLYQLKSLHQLLIRSWHSLKQRGESVTNNFIY